MAVTQFVGDASTAFLVSTLAFIMALLVAQTRVESGIHSTLEVVYGARARRARDPRRLPGVRDDRPRSSRARAEADAARERLRAVLASFLVGAARARARRALFEGVNVENAAYPLGVCAEGPRSRAPSPTGYRPGDLEAIGDHGVAVRRLPPVARRVPRRPRRPTARDGELVAHTPAELLPDTFVL